MSYKFICGECLNILDEFVVYLDNHIFCPLCGEHIDKYMEADEYEV